MRYHPHTEADRKEMLAAMGMKSMQDLFADIPEKVRLTRELNIPGGPLSEQELVKHLGELSGKNANLAEYVSFLGGGVYDHYIPSAVNHLLLRSEFFTAYTPYQPEISQGTLTAIFEYQTLICRLTGMEVANASMYDGASALAEAVLMAAEAVRRKEILLSAAVHPEYREVVKTYARGQGLAVAEVPFTGGITDLDALKAKISGNTAAVVVQNPNFFGCIEPVLELGEAAHSQGGLYIVAVEPVSLGILKPPGEYGADIVVGDGQSLGTPPQLRGTPSGVYGCHGKTGTADAWPYCRSDGGHQRGAGLCAHPPGQGTAHQAGESHLQYLFQSGLKCPGCNYLPVLAGQKGNPGTGGTLPAKSPLSCRETGGASGFPPGLFRAFLPRVCGQDPGRACFNQSGPAEG